MVFVKKSNGGWLLDPEYTDDPFDLQVQLDELEDRIAAGINGGIAPGTGGGVGVSVADYGALGDGSTDDTAAIQAAIADVAGVGGIVFFPAGTYITSRLTIYDRMVFVGEGMGASVLKLKSGSNTALVQSENYTANVASGTALGPGYFGLENITLDGNLAQNASGDYVYKVYGYAHRARDIEIINGKGGGVFTTWGSYAYAGNMECIWSGFFIRNCENDGLHIEGPHDSKFSDGEINYLGSGQMNRAIYVGGTGAGGVGTELNHIHTWGKHVVGVKADQRIKANGMECEGAGDVNVWLIASFCLWNGGWIYGTNGTGSINSNEGAVRFGDSTLPSGTADCVVQGVQINNFAASGFLFDYSKSFTNWVKDCFTRMFPGSSPTQFYKGSPNNERVDLWSSVNPAHDIHINPSSPWVRSAAFTAKGDLMGATGPSVPAKLAAGPDGTVLLADSTASTGLRWGAAPNPTSPVTIGLSGAGTSIQEMSNGVKYASKFPVTQNGLVKTATADLDGNGILGGSGTQQLVRMVLWADDSGVAGQPGTTVGVSDPITILLGQPRSLVTFTFGAGQQPTVVLGTNLWIGFQGGSTGGVARYGFSAGTIGQVYKSDSYGDGTDVTFGSGGTTVNGQAIQVSALVTPPVQSLLTAFDSSGGQLSDLGAISEIEAGDGIVFTLEDDNRLIVEVDPAFVGSGTGSGLSIAQETIVPLGVGDVYHGLPISGDELGYQGFASADSNVAGAVNLEASTDGLLWQTRRSSVTTSVGGRTYADTTALMTDAYYRRSYVNGGTAQTTFKLLGA